MDNQNTNPFQNDTMIVYRGGGYDGCIWEYNYAYIDENGEFHPVHATGSMGCKTLQQLEERFANLKGKEFEFYNFAIAEQINYFADHEAIKYVLIAITYFVEHGINKQIKLECAECDQRFNPFDKDNNSMCPKCVCDAGEDNSEKDD